MEPRGTWQSFREALEEARDGDGNGVPGGWLNPDGHDRGWPDHGQGCGPPVLPAVRIRVLDVAVVARLPSYRVAGRPAGGPVRCHVTGDGSSGEQLVHETGSASWSRVGCLGPAGVARPGERLAAALGSSRARLRRTASGLVVGTGAVEPGDRDLARTRSITGCAARRRDVSASPGSRKASVPRYSSAARRRTGTIGVAQFLVGLAVVTLTAVGGPAAALWPALAGARLRGCGACVVARLGPPARGARRHAGWAAASGSPTGASAPTRLAWSDEVGRRPVGQELQGERGPLSCPMAPGEGSFLVVAAEGRARGQGSTVAHPPRTERLAWDTAGLREARSAPAGLGEARESDHRGRHAEAERPCPIRWIRLESGPSTILEHHDGTADLPLIRSHSPQRGLRPVGHPHVEMPAIPGRADDLSADFRRGGDVIRVRRSHAPVDTDVQAAPRAHGIGSASGAVRRPGLH